ncbi:MAG: type II secretion system protein [Candidatus Saccharimonadales bacterium]
MILQKTLKRGFTIVELLIVIVVIGILAALVIVTYNGVQQKARDSERKTDINALNGLIQTYNAEKAYFPSLTEMNTDSFRSTNMKGLDAEALKDPKGSAQTLVGTAAANSYAYDVKNASDASCEADPTTCAKYTLTATLEGGGTFAKSGSN